MGFSAGGGTRNQRPIKKERKMKKVLLAGAALMLVGGIASTASAAAVEPGVKITGDARVRFAYKNDAYDYNDNNSDASQTNMDSRVRLNIAGTAAGGAYGKVRLRVYEGLMGDSDVDSVAFNNSNTNSVTADNNLWADQAYVGIPFNDMFTLEMGKYRSTYGPLPLTYNFFYDDVNLTGARGIIKTGNIEINPFIEWMDEAQNAVTNPAATPATNDAVKDHDEIRYGAHIKAKINQDWTVGGILGYQDDARDEVTPDDWTSASRITANDGFFGSIYTNGKSGAFGFTGELAVTESGLNGFNSWLDDENRVTPADAIGSDNTGFGGYIFPTYTIDKLTLGLNLGFTADGFLPDRAFGFVMLGSTDNSWISAQRIGVTGDWLWGGLVAQYTINDSLKLTGNLVYADIEPWTEAGDGPGFRDTTAQNDAALDNAWELSAVLQYTISKGADVYFSAGYLKPSFENSAIADDAAFGALTRFELKF
jgi:hypothetical protein